MYALLHTNKGKLVAINSKVEVVGLGLAQRCTGRKSCMRSELQMILTARNSSSMTGDVKSSRWEKCNCCINQKVTKKSLKDEVKKKSNSRMTEENNRDLYSICQNLGEIIQHKPFARKNDLKSHISWINVEF